MKERQSNTELLRIIAMIGVIILHINNPSIGGGITAVTNDSINQYVIYFFESLFAIGVNLFILISGYYMVNSCKRDFWRVIELLLQVVIVNIIFYFGGICFGKQQFSLKSFFYCMLPINYYAILYCVLYLISPYLNIIINYLSENGLHIMIIGCVVLFAVFPTGVDVLTELSGNSLKGLSTIGLYGSQFGYTIINFILMYLLGSYIRRSGVFQKIKTYKLVIGMMICTILLVLWAKLNDFVGYDIERSAWEYCNPILILECCIVFALFSRILIKPNKIINTLSKSTFMVFLIHTRLLVFFDFTKIVHENVVVMCVEILVIACLIYFVCCVIDFIYRKTVGYCIKKIKEKHKLTYELKLEYRN